MSFGRYRNGFTMIELVFVIVILGILAAIAIPKFAATRDDAEISKGRSDVAAVRAGIVTERQSRLLTGDSSYIDVLDDATAGSEGDLLFDKNNILTYGIVAKNGNGHWMKTGTNTYAFKVMNQAVTFTYADDNGTFMCDRSAGGNAGEYCKQLTD